jgi:hypothetical protein
MRARRTSWPAACTRRRTRPGRLASSYGQQRPLVRVLVIVGTLHLQFHPRVRVPRQAGQVRDHPPRRPAWSEARRRERGRVDIAGEPRTDDRQAAVVGVLDAT